MQRRRCCPCSPLVKIQAPPLQHFLFSSQLQRWLVCFQKEKPERDRVDVELLRTICCCFSCLSRFSFLLTFLHFSIPISLCVCFQWKFSFLLWFSGSTVDFFLVFLLSGVDSVLRLTLGALSEFFFAHFQCKLDMFHLFFVCWLAAFTVNSRLLPTRREVTSEWNGRWNKRRDQLWNAKFAAYVFRMRVKEQERSVEK